MKHELDKFNTFVCELRGPVELKGKGTVTTWWLVSEGKSTISCTPHHDRRKNSQASFKQYDPRTANAQLNIVQAPEVQVCTENGTVHLASSDV